jgi:hypothetical protein
MATTPQFDLKGHLLSLQGLTRESTKMARFYDANHKVIAERASDGRRVLVCRQLMLEQLSCSPMDPAPKR